MRLLNHLALSLLGLSAALSAQVPSGAEPGTRFEIRHSYQTQSMKGERATGSSQGHSTLIEQVVAWRDGGVELIYDEPDPDKRREWQLPVRVFKPAQGPMQLLNRAELEARVDPWLTKAKWTRDICGRWIFTWSAFRIDCDPASALGIVESYSLWQDDLKDNAPFRMAGWLGTPRIKLERSSLAGSVFTVSGDLDPGYLRLGQAKSDVVVAQVGGHSISEEQALAKLADWEFSGSVTVRFTTDADGLMLERAETTEKRILAPGSEVKMERLVSRLVRRRLN